MVSEEAPRMWAPDACLHELQYDMCMMMSHAVGGRRASSVTRQRSEGAVRDGARWAVGCLRCVYLRHLYTLGSRASERPYARRCAHGNRPNEWASQTLLPASPSTPRRFASHAHAGMSVDHTTYTSELFSGKVRPSVRPSVFR